MKVNQESDQQKELMTGIKKRIKNEY